MSNLYVLLLLIGIVAVPFLLNIILGAPNPLSNIAVIGDSTHWLAFYGSYIGGVLTAIVGFITLYRESKQNKLQLEIRSKEDALKELKLVLSERISLFDFSRVIEISLYAKDETMYNLIQRNLSEYYSLLTTKTNAWGTIYAASKQLEVVRFKNAYIDCYNAFNDCINSITSAICCLAETGDNNKKDEIISNMIIPVTQKMTFVNNKLQSLFDAAQKWIEAEDKEIERLKGLL